MRREWFKPLAWVLDNLRWSARHDNVENMTTRRSTSMTFLELACVADILTGAMIGPPGSSFAMKTAIVKNIFEQLSRKQMADTTEQAIALGKAIQELPQVKSAAATGFAALPGVDRRACLGAFPGLHTALGTLLSFAAASREKLATPMPRYIWCQA